MSIPAAGPVSADLTVLGGNPTAAELAAVTAVIVGVLQERDTDRASLTSAGPNGWQRSRLPLQVSITPGPGAWRNISA